jgi:hypothetical protein
MNDAFSTVRSIRFALMLIDFQGRIVRAKYGPALIMRGLDGKDVIYMGETGSGPLGR